jgi:hypothetical protein
MKVLEHVGQAFRPAAGLSGTDPFRAARRAAQKRGGSPEGLPPRLQRSGG